VDTILAHEILGEMKKNEKHIDETLLELFLLDDQLPESQRKEIEEHLDHCRVCQHKLAELVMFYDILKEEMDKPIPEEVKKLLERMENKK
jgi:anti-sigma factor RsiW